MILHRSLQHPLEICQQLFSEICSDRNHLHLSVNVIPLCQEFYLKPSRVFMSFISWIKINSMSATVIEHISLSHNTTWYATDYISTLPTSHHVKTIGKSVLLLLTLFNWRLKLEVNLHLSIPSQLLVLLKHLLSVKNLNWTKEKSN